MIEAPGRAPIRRRASTANGEIDAARAEADPARLITLWASAQRKVLEGALNLAPPIAHQTRTP